MRTIHCGKIFGGLLASGLLAALAACGGTTPVASPATVVPQAAVATRATSIPQTNAALAAALGDEIQIGSLNLAVTDLSTLQPDDLSLPEPGNLLLGVTIRLTNNGSEPHIVSSLLQMALRDDAGTRYDIDFAASMLAGDDPDGELAPGATVQGAVGFQVPADASDLRFVFDDPIEGAGEIDLGELPAAAAPTENSAVAEQAELQTYTHPSGAFQLDLPSDLSANDLSEPGSVHVEWVGDGLAVQVQIVQADRDYSQDELATLVSTSTKASFGDSAGFELSAAEPQDDGSMLISWQATLDVGNGPELVQNYSYVEQRGDKLSIIVIGAPAEQFDELWDSLIGPLVNSYSIDETASLS